MKQKKLKWSRFEMARIAIAGNPNAGKTCIFNHLTGTTQQVSNYPGVTVEIKEGTVKLSGRKITVVDLPGTYSLTAYSQEELVARNFIIEEKPDILIDVVDASNLERNLYLAVQFMEMQVPMVLALNMVDVAVKRGFNIDAEKLSGLFGIPVMPTVGNKGKGVDELIRTCIELFDSKEKKIPLPVTYGHEVDQEINALTRIVKKYKKVSDSYNPRWICVKLIERDEIVISSVRDLCGKGFSEIEKAAEKAIHSIETHFGEDAATIIAERRYGYASGAIKKCVKLTGEARQNMTDKIDMVVCNRFFGPVILVAVVAALFFWVFKISDEWAWIPWFNGWLSPTGLMGWFFEQLSALVSGLELSAPVLHSLLNDGMIGGVGGVMGFVPLIFIMFLFLSALEDSGYIARIAFILDRMLQIFGLQGKSILAMLVSGGLGAGGCAVPGVMATRTLREEKDRLITMLVAPFMNCGAKMPVYAMLIAAFFPARRTQMMLILWGISWIVALFAALILRKFIIKGEQTPFVMELPPYHVPTFKGVMIHTWERTWMYVKKAGTIILAINVLMWAFMFFPRLPEKTLPDSNNTKIQITQDERSSQELAYSFAGRLGSALEPVSKLAGFDWRTNISLIGGFAAKEVVIGTLGTAFSMGESDAEDFEGLSARLASDKSWGPLKAFVLMIFVMIYAPCFVTIVAIKRESGSWKWALFSTVYSTAIAYFLSVFIYQAGLLAGFG
jgi:ferrous iron transport protein B